MIRVYLTDNTHLDLPEGTTCVPWTDRDHRRATAAKLREQGLRSATRKNRADRRAGQREKLVRVAEDRGLAPTPGEPTKALKNRLRERFSLPKMKG